MDTSTASVAASVAVSVPASVPAFVSSNKKRKHPSSSSSSTASFDASWCEIYSTLSEWIPASVCEMLMNDYLITNQYLLDHLDPMLISFRAQSKQRLEEAKTDSGIKFAQQHGTHIPKLRARIRKLREKLQDLKDEVQDYRIKAKANQSTTIAYTQRHIMRELLGGGMDRYQPLLRIAVMMDLPLIALRWMIQYVDVDQMKFSIRYRVKPDEVNVIDPQPTLPGSCCCTRKSCDLFPPHGASNLSRLHIHIFLPVSTTKTSLIQPSVDRQPLQIHMDTGCFENPDSEMRQLCPHELIKHEGQLETSPTTIPRFYTLPRFYRYFPRKQRIHLDSTIFIGKIALPSGFSSVQSVSESSIELLYETMLHPNSEGSMKFACILIEDWIIYGLLKWIKYDHRNYIKPISLIREWIRYHVTPTEPRSPRAASNDDSSTEDDDNDEDTEAEDE